MSSETRPLIEHLDVGAGRNPHPEADRTLDVREDIAVDHPGVDISRDEWPIPDSSVHRVTGVHVLEHVEPDRWGHVFSETRRVLTDVGSATWILPHAGTWSAATDPTHGGTGGTTPDVRYYFQADGPTAQYWDGWTVDAWADVVLSIGSITFQRRVRDGHLSQYLSQLPRVEADVTLEMTLL